MDGRHRQSRDNHSGGRGGAFPSFSVVRLDCSLRRWGILRRNQFFRKVVFRHRCVCLPVPGYELVWSVKWNTEKEDGGAPDSRMMSGVAYRRP